MYAKIFFYIFTSLALIAASGVIFSVNMMSRVLCLILLFITTAAVWILIKANFLALLLALIYVGAVLVLFIFVVMVFDLKFNNNKRHYGWFVMLGIVVTGMLFSVLIYVITTQGLTINDGSSLVPKIVNSRELMLIGKHLFTQHLIPFEMAGMLLLAAIVAAIGLIVRGLRE